MNSLLFWTFTGRQNPGGALTSLKSDWEVDAVSPGVADHSTLGIAACAGLVAVHVAGCSPGVRKVHKSEWRIERKPLELRITSQGG